MCDLSQKMEMGGSQLQPCPIQPFQAFGGSEPVDEEKEKEGKREGREREWEGRGRDLSSAGSLSKGQQWATPVQSWEPKASSRSLMWE